MIPTDNEIRLFSAGPTDDPDISGDCDCDCKAPAVPLVLRSKPEDLEPHMEQCDCKSASVSVVFPYLATEEDVSSSDQLSELEPLAPFIINILPLYAN